MKAVVVAGAFDDLSLRHVRFLQEAARAGPLHVSLYSDEAVKALTGAEPTYPTAEREYLLRSIRYVDSLTVLSAFPGTEALPVPPELDVGTWAVEEREDSKKKAELCAERGIDYRVLRSKDLAGLPPEKPPAAPSGRPRVVVTGCFDYLHSGHVAFFEEVAGLGELCVVVGHDANIRLLKGKGHPMFPQEERVYMVRAVRFVHRAILSTGEGWMDAAPEILELKPAVYAVNEDGDVPEKRAFCQTHGIEYAVLRRLPKPGLPRRDSTRLRGY